MKPRIIIELIYCICCFVLYLYERDTAAAKVMLSEIKRIQDKCPHEVS